jgi:hypothetical protein
VNGDGVTGFGPGVPPETRTRDELAAHIDLANLSRPDVLLSIHINSFTENGVVVEIAGTETYWTDETAWGVPFSERLATEVQTAVVAALDDLATYEREDRGIEAVNYYVIAPPTTTDNPAQPRRGSLMPAVLAEVGSMSLEAEADLLASDGAQPAIAQALTEALVEWFAAREVAGRIDLLAPGGEAGTPPPALPGEGPMYWAPIVEDPSEVVLRLTNTGTAAWPADGQLLAGWAVSDEPYLARPPELTPLEVSVPALRPGESVTVEVAMPAPPSTGRALAWVTVELDGQVLAEIGNPALQFEAGDPSS